MGRGLEALGALLDVGFTLLVVLGSLLYYLIPLFQRWSKKRMRLWLRNQRSYLLVFEYARLFITIWAYLGLFLRALPRVAGALEARSIDLLGTAEHYGLHLEPATLERVRLCVLALGCACVALGLASWIWTRRDAFEGVPAAIRYYVLARDHALDAASYFALRGGVRVEVTEIYDLTRREEWERVARGFHNLLCRLDAGFRTSGQGENVRVVLELPGLHLHYWRLGAHAYLVAQPRRVPPPEWERRFAAERMEEMRGSLLGRWLWAEAPVWFPDHEDQGVRALVAAIRSIASIHGA